MGTVGLSFGSPTSGAGFDVSSTVSAIVANLQNVETPWKTQLTNLESQDTVISNLGALLSNVSNDLSQLTDFTGIMAQKTGSSSNEDVLELDSATSSAVAGTHTVVVNSLAQTSSGYLAEVSSASAAVSGSITLAVGSGTAQTITLNSSENTLTGLASAINASGVGINASVLTDATGSRLSLVSGTSGAGSNIVVSDNSLVVGAPNTLAYAGTAGSTTVTSSGTLAAVANLSDSLSGSISIAVGSGTATQVTMSEVSTAEGGTTLADVVSYIQANSSALGVSASVVTNSDGTSSLGLTSLTAGAAGTLTVTSNITDPGTALAYTSTVTGSNASLTVDGVNLTSASNTVTNLIPGVTFQLLSTSDSPVQVVIGNDNTDVESTVNQFVSDYNSLISALNTQQGNDSSGNPEPLFGSPTLSLLQQQLMSSLNTQNPNGSLDPVASGSGTTLSGSITIQMAGGTATTVEVPSQDESLAGLATAINAQDIGVTAAIQTVSGESTLSLFSETAGPEGALSVTSNLTASNGGTNTALNYNNSSDLSTLANLGITVSDKDDGSLDFDATTLDSVLNTDYGGAVGFFQNVNSWGQEFASMLENAGTSSPTGVLSLASSSNSSIESTLNADMTREQSMISAQQTTLTAELNSANEILQQLPSQLQGVNELYAAITGYNENQNG